MSELSKKSTPLDTESIDAALSDIRQAMDSKEEHQDVLELTEVAPTPPSSASASQSLPANEDRFLEGAQPAVEVNNKSIDAKDEKGDILDELDTIASKSSTRDRNEKISSENLKPANDAAPLRHKAIDNSTENSVATNNLEPVLPDGLLNEEVANKSQKILKSYLKAATKNHAETIQFRSGQSLEDLVIEMLKPELSAWLNKNLPQLVKSVVEEEIKKLIPQDE